MTGNIDQRSDQDIRPQKAMAFGIGAKKDLILYLIDQTASAINLRAAPKRSKARRQRDATNHLRKHDAAPFEDFITSRLG